MSPSSTRLLATTTSRLSSLSLGCSVARHTIRPFSSTCLRLAEPERPTSLLHRLRSNPQPAQSSGPPREAPGTGSGGTMSTLQHILAFDTISRATNQPTSGDSVFGANVDMNKKELEPFHFHIYAHKHNAHITVTKPNRQAIISLSAGNIGFKKAKRGSYDAAYQLTAYVLDKLNQMGYHREITQLEVVLRGFGSGREAATKVLLGNEGRLLRNKIVKVSDATRIKFGGTRSPKPRRLG